jgi:hypothetical protein
MNVDDLYNKIIKEKDVTAALKMAHKDANISETMNIIPLVMYKTHVTTILDGVEKMISIADFKNIVDDLTGEVDVVIPPINLPFGCFMFNKKGDNMYLNCYYRGETATIKYDHRGTTRKTEEYKIPMPNIITYFNLKRVDKAQWQVVEAKYFATPKTVTQLPDKALINNTNNKEGIYRMPFSNVYGDNKLCYGDNTMPARLTDNLRGLDYYYQILTLSPFNSDLGVNGVKGFHDPRPWYQHLSALKEFPYDLLTNS